MDKYLYDIWLVSATKGSNVYISRALEEYGTAEAVYKDMGRRCHFGRNDANVKQEFVKKGLDYAEGIIKKCRDNNIEIIGKDSGWFPEFLLNSPVCPLVLYAKGNKDLLKKSLITITGTRRANFEGRENARKFSQVLAGAGLGIVTGFADGIEETVIKSVNEVISVLPCGFLKLYPKEHSSLIDKIEATGGLALSQFEPDTEAYRWNYSLRNKMFTALSESTLIIQAGEGSATNMTFNNCAEYSRTCYALPGPIDDSYYINTNEYLKNGATLVTSPTDIINDYGISFEQQQEEKKEYSFSDVQRKIIKAIKDNPVSCDKICQVTNLDIGTVLTEILQLELIDVIARTDEDKIKLIIKE